MAEDDFSNVHDLNNVSDSPNSATPVLPSNMVNPENALIDTMMSALLIRGDIRCRLSTKFKCGYEIRPIVWFSKRTDEIERTLEAIGLAWRNIFVTTEDIAKLCHAFSKFFNLSPMSKQLKLVASLNGLLPQPLDYDEVVETLTQIETYSEAL